MQRKAISLILTLGISLWLAAAALGKDSEFSMVVKQLENQLQTRHTRLPFWGFARIILKVTQPGRGIDLAVFEDRKFPPVDSQELEQKIFQSLGSSWQPLVRVRSKKGKELTLVCAKVKGEKMTVMVVSIEEREAAVVRLNLPLEDVSNWIAKETCYRHIHESREKERGVTSIKGAESAAPKTFRAD
jgi:hypothetical protein